MTKKTIFNGVLLAFLLTLGVSFNSCQKEGVYNPKQKISKIYGEFYREEGKFLLQEWAWDKNLLGKIDYWGMAYEDGNEYPEIFYTDRFFYEKSRVIKVDHGDGFYSKIYYSGSNYDKLETFDSSGGKVMSANYTYKNNKVSNISLTLKIGDFFEKPIQIRLLSFFLPKELISRTFKSIENIGKSKGVDEVNFILDYTYKGDNIKEITVKNSFMGINFATSTVTYVSHDKKQNPFFKKFQMVFLSEISFGMVSIESKNNPLEVTTTYQDDLEIETRTVKFSYTYDGNFPITVTESQIIFDELIQSKHVYEYK
jgi:hypothetical protein